VEQATATTPTAPTPRTDGFRHALGVADALVPFLKQPPLAVEIDDDAPYGSGWRVHLKYGEMRGAGLFEFAALIDVPVTRVTTAFGVHLDAIALIENIEVRGSALVSLLEAARLEGVPAPEPVAETPEEDLPASDPVQPSSSVLAEMPALAPVVPSQAAGLGAEDEARCVRCGCTENAACETGCYWVPNLQMTDLCSACATVEELAAVTYTQAQPQEAPAEVPAQRLASPLMHRIPVIPAQETGQ
jgi:hypothetical protein